MPIYSRFDAEKCVVSSFTPSANLLKMFDEIIPLGTVLSRRQFYKDYLPKYEHKKIIVNGRTFSVRPAWTDYKPDPGTHIIIIGHILLCHIFSNQAVYQQPSTRLFSEDTKQQLRQFKALLDRVNQHKYPNPPVAKKKVFA